MSGALPARPITILIAALGGEGGGVLADWLVTAAEACGYPVQSTSIPGVSQRTGATTYYVEIYPVPAAQLGARAPVMALIPTPGAVDVMAATELVEAGRAMSNAFISADSTVLIASTHRVYAMAEKVEPLDNRFDRAKVLAALERSARRAVLFDMAQIARQNGAMINSVLFGALAGSGALPLPREACEQAIRTAGKGYEASLRGFVAGFEQACGAPDAVLGAPPEARPAVQRMVRKFPPQTFGVLEVAIARLIDYQDQAYAELFLDRLEPVLALDREAGGAAGGYKLTCETGRLLALWMSFEDIVRVAQLKTSKSRFERVRMEVGVAPDQLLRVTEFMKPGLEEFCSILPQRFAQRVQNWAQRKGKEKQFSRALQIKTSTISGFLLVRGLCLLKPFRRNSSRYRDEQAHIERWLGAIKRLGFAVQDLDLAYEIAQCAVLIKGYSSTHCEGTRQFNRIFETLIESGSEPNPKKLAEAIRQARLAALANPDAPKPVQKTAGSDTGKPVFWMPRKSSGRKES